MTKRETSVVIDPVAMNITNKVAADTKSAGKLECRSGMLLEGEHNGDLVVHGTLVVAQGARLSGTSTVYGDVYVFGNLGETGAAHCILTVHGTLHLTKTAVAYGKMQCLRVATYDGAKVHGVFKTLDASPSGDPTQADQVLIANSEASREAEAAP